MTNPIEKTQETTLRDFLNVVFRRKWLILSVVGITTFLVFFLNARRPDLYESSAKILVMRGEQTNVLAGHVRYLGWEEEVSSHIEVILSQAVFDRAAEMFADSVAARDYPEHWKFNPGGVRADVIGESNAFVVRYIDFESGVCQLGCETATLSFQEFYRARKAPPELADFFSEGISDVRSDLDHWRDRREKFLDGADYYGADETSRFLLNKIASLEGKITKLNGEIMSQQIRVDNLAVLSRKTGAQLERELAFSASRRPMQSQITQTIKTSLQNYTLLREELRQKYTEKHPELIAVNGQIRSLHEDLRRQVSNAYRVEQEALDGFKARRAELMSELARVKKPLEDIPGNQRELSEIDAMIARLEKKHELLLNRQSSSEIAIASRPDWKVTILSHASGPLNKKTSDYVRLALGPFLAVVVGLGIAFFLESTDHSISNTAEAEEFLHLPVLATLSEMQLGDEEVENAEGG
ncbi:MAG: hypothetical protein IH969_08870 [Candidatus Krumholzibacteriota bacterium]|nr:hypothetical protein [Candidatus Krumholzibacteriota bacterium]